jgi:thiosulfate/3-mercaptopyruvate sulfurtransferase
MSRARIQPLIGGCFFAITMLTMAALQAQAEPAAVAVTKAGPETPAPDATAQPTAEHLIEPADLARLLSGKGSRPEILHVGPAVLFRSAHISGSRHVGPASTPEGLQALKQALRDIPQRQSIVVLYCGCCPWDDCPNVRPALKLARELGRNDVKLLYLPRNLQIDWIDQGLPSSRGEQ